MYTLRHVWLMYWTLMVFAVLFLLVGGASHFLKDTIAVLVPLVFSMTGLAICMVAAALAVQTRYISQLEQRLNNLDKATNESDQTNISPPDGGK